MGLVDSLRVYSTTDLAIEASRISVPAADEKLAADHARSPGSLLASQTQPRLTLTCPSRTILVPSTHEKGSSPGESGNVCPSL